jgi:hypothetical protein
MSKIFIEEIFGIPIEDISHIFGIPVSQLLKMYEALLSSSSSSSSSMSYSSSSSSSSESVATMDWDTGITPDTIAPNSGVTIAVENGRGPYSWSITSGTGYTLDDVTTTDLDNGLHVSGVTCGINYSATVTVQVVDDIGTTITKIFRNTGGHWGEQCTYGVDGCGYDEPAGCVTCTPTEEWFYGEGVDANKSWKTFSYACRGAGCFWGTYGTCPPVHAPIPTDCLAPHNCPCSDGSCSHGGYTCVPQSLGYNLWVC